MTPPQEFIDLMAEWMIAHGPDGHCDGHEEIARLAWEWMQSRKQDNLCADCRSTLQACIECGQDFCAHCTSGGDVCEDCEFEAAQYDPEQKEDAP